MSSDTPTNSSSGGPVVCPGCGGRNTPNAYECDWCGRPFVVRSRQFRLTAWQIVSTALLLALIGAVLVLAVLNASRSVSRPRAAPTPVAAQETSPAPDVTPLIDLTSTETVVGAPGAGEGPNPAAPLPPQTVRVTNTGGSGVVVRLEPGPQGPQVGTLREGTEVNLTGGQQTVDARLWHEIEEQDRGIRGWVSSEFLAVVP
jgi:hypothetical protein